MAFQDLREWLSFLEEKGELKRIEAQVDWDQEIGAIGRENFSRRGPALLFQNIKDYTDTPCRQLLMGTLGSPRRVRYALGIPEGLSEREIVLSLKDKFRHPLEPITVETGPVKENILRGKEVDLYQFPVPWWNYRDGGRYIFTMVSMVTQDPVTAEINLGAYRGMIVDRDKVAVLLSRSQDWGKHFTQWEVRGEEMPIAAVIGWDPHLFMCSGTPLSLPEYGVCGAIREEPVPLVKCETNELLVPASAEIVIEGRISSDPATFALEGPFAEYTGYYAGVKGPRPVMKVDCITFRHNPIFTGLVAGASPGRYPSDGHWLKYFFCAACWSGLENAGIPGIVDITFDGGPEILKVRIHKSYRTHAQHLANAIWGLKFANLGAKILIVVDDDIDIRSRGAVDWAMASRINPAMGDIAFFDTMGSSLDPSVPLEQRDVMKYGDGIWRRMLIDATISWDLEPRPEYDGKRFPPLGTEISPQMQELIQRRWKEYGF